MGNLIIAGDFEDIYGTSAVSSRNQDSDHPDNNICDFRHLKKDYRAQDATLDDWLLKIDFGAAQTLAALFLNDVNFNKVKIEGNATDVWTSPSFSETFNIGLDDRVQRYKAYLTPTLTFNYRYLRIYIPADATKVWSLPVWAVGSVAALESVITLSPNITYGYEYDSDIEVNDKDKLSGGKERSGRGTNLKWTGEIPIGRRTPTDEAQLWTLNALNRAEPHVLYENEGSTQYAYLCWREGPVRITREANRRIQAAPIRFTEII